LVKLGYNSERYQLKKIFVCLLLASTFGFNLQCGKDAPPIDFLARVGDSYLTREMAMHLFPDFEQLAPPYPKQIQIMINRWVQREVLFQEAQKYHFQKDAEIRRKVDQYDKDLTIDALLKYIFETQLIISERDVEDYYNSYREGFKRNLNEARIIHVVVEDLDVARRIKNALASNNQEALDQFLGQYPFETKIVFQGQAIQEIDKNIFENRNQTVIGPIASDFGYHTIKVLDRYRAGSVRSLNEVRDEIIQRLTQQKIEAGYYQLLDSLLLTADIEIQPNTMSGQE
jgi:preprotein translocase subunit SecA